MIDHAAMQGTADGATNHAIPDDPVTLAETLPPVCMLLGGVPVMTILVMTAVRYVASGTI